MTVHLDPVWQVVTVTVALGFAWLSWRYVERPFRARITTSPAPRRVFAISAMGMAVVSVLAGAVWMTEGAKLRFSPQELAMLASLDVDPALRACRKHQHPDHLCSFGAPPETATGTWLLWGDSHAEAALPALDAWARDQNKTLRLATLPACAPLPGITRLDQPADRQAACRRFLRAIETHVLQDDRYERVWLHARWPLYIEGRRYGDDDSTTIILAAEGAELGANISADSNPALAKGALERLLIRFLARGVEVTVIGSLPEMPWDVAQQVQAQVLYGTAMPPGVHRDLVATRQQRTEAVLAQAARLAGAEWLPITAQICQPACPTHDARSIFYRDNHHLTRDGALNLLLPLLRAAMTGQASPQSRIAP